MTISPGSDLAVLGGTGRQWKVDPTRAYRITYPATIMKKAATPATSYVFLPLSAAMACQFPVNPPEMHLHLIVESKEIRQREWNNLHVISAARLSADTSFPYRQMRHHLLLNSPYPMSMRVQDRHTMAFRKIVWILDCFVIRGTESHGNILIGLVFDVEGKPEVGVYPPSYLGQKTPMPLWYPDPIVVVVVRIWFRFMRTFTRARKSSAVTKICDLKHGEMSLYSKKGQAAAAIT